MTTSYGFAPEAVERDECEFVRGMMRWHFDPATGSPFWVRRARGLDFDPVQDVRRIVDLARFPDVTDELRDVPASDLVPVGYGRPAPVVGIFESGGTTGTPKRVVLTEDWAKALIEHTNRNLDAHGVPREAEWLGVVPSGPHIVGEFFRRTSRTHGRWGHTVDLDPRWVRRCFAEGRPRDVAAYVAHVVDQVADILRTQDVSVLNLTPALLERMADRPDLTELIRRKVKAIRWGGTTLDPDSRAFYRREMFPEIVLLGNYGGTMMLGVAGERPGGGDDRCVFDFYSPCITARVVDPATDEAVPFGERGQVVLSHLSRGFFLPNNHERDEATRVPAPPGGAGDSVADVTPLSAIADEVIEGVY